MFTFYDAADLQNRQCDPIPMLVPGLSIPAVGVTLLCGKPKEGKSWFALELACSVASGTNLFDPQNRIIPRHNVLYADLENGEHRLARRLGQIGVRMSPRTLTFMTYTSGPEDGRSDLLEGLIRAGGVKLLIVDTLEAFRPKIASDRASLYAEDYAAVNELHMLAQRLNIAVIVVHHTRKPRENFTTYLDEVLGTRGLTGAADTIAVLRKDRLWITGRDLEEDMGGMWILYRTGPLFHIGEKVEEEEEAQQKGKPAGRPMDWTWRAALLEAMRLYPEASQRELAEILGVKYDTLKKRVQQLRREGMGIPLDGAS